MSHADARPAHLSRPTSYLAACVVVLASTLVAELLYRVLHTNRLSPVFLAGVLVTAVRYGSGPAYLTAILAFGIYNFYLVEPRFTLSSLSAEDVLLLVVFLSVAMLTGRLAGRVRDQAAGAQARARTANTLFEASRAFSGLNDEKLIEAELLRHVSSAAGSPAALYRARTATVVPADARLPPPVLDALSAGSASEPPPGWRLRLLMPDQPDLGRIAWQDSPFNLRQAGDDPLIDVLVDVGAAAIIRARLAAAEAEVRALSETERLRNALLSSISHDLRTPLASILASASSLRDFGDRFEPAVRDDLLATIQEEAERLNQFVANLLSMTRLEGGALGIRAGRVDLREVAERVVARLSRRAGQRRITIGAEVDGLEAYADPILLEQALANVVENAVRFSPPESTVLLSAARIGGEVILEVSDEGPGVPPEDLCRIFDKFYRSPATAGALQGTGLGLSIVRGLVESMGGCVRARRRNEAGGLTVSLFLPAGGVA